MVPQNCQNYLWLWFMRHRLYIEFSEAGYNHLLFFFQLKKKTISRKRPTSGESVRIQQSGSIIEAVGSAAAHSSVSLLTKPCTFLPSYYTALKLEFNLAQHCFSTTCNHLYLPQLFTFILKIVKEIIKHGTPL